MPARRLAALVALMSALVALAAPGAALGVGQVLEEAHEELADYDSRRGEIAPTQGQRTIVDDLGAQAAWNRFGTPSTLVRRDGGALARGVEGDSAVAAAQRWLSEHRALFRLASTGGLELHHDGRLARSEARAVTFRQTYGDLDAAGGGLVTVALAPEDAGWRVVSASSTLSGDETVASGSRVGPERAWARAAASVGKRHSLRDVDAISAAKRSGGGWKLLQAERLPGLQRVREVAFPTVRSGVVPAYETLVLDTEATEPVAYRVFVDARSQRVLARESLVHHQGDAGRPTFEFSGELAATNGACDTRKGPYRVEAGAGVRAIDVLANADAPNQDLVLRLLREDAVVAQADALNTPERIRYAPEGGVPEGEYFAQVCESEGGGPPVEPRTYRGSLTLDASPAPAPYLARWRVFEASPPLARQPRDPWGHPSDDIRARWCQRPAAEDAEACSRIVGNLASRAPWDFDPRSNLPSNTTIGNNAVTAESWTDPSLPAPNQFRPVSPTRDYSFPWTNAWNRSDCDPGTPYGSAFVPGESLDVSAAVTNLFAMHNRMHDWSYLLGFTEANWNAQARNFGLTEPFQEGDPLLGDAQAGAALPPPLVYAFARDNANMITLPDGSSPVTNMYLWQPLAGAFYAPCVDGDYDMGVIGHEYTHLIENRMIGKGANRTGHHAGAMGESHSDLLAMEQLLGSDAVPVGDENPFATGTYVTGNKLRGIRNYAPNFPPAGALPEPSRYPRSHPLNFSDVGYDLTGPQVHADGEIWTGTQFELRGALARKHEREFPERDRALQRRCAESELPVDRCPGNRRWVQLVMDSFLLMPTAPTMLDARNAILAADTLRFGGANHDVLWAVFARRGLGEGASSTNTTGRRAGVESDVDPLPDFASPRGEEAEVTFAAETREAGQSVPVGARIFVGHYEGRVSPVADTDAETTAPEGASANNLDEVAGFAPGTYEFVATAPGHGHLRFRQTLAPGARRITLRFAPNVASASRGARASGDATPVRNLPGTNEVVGSEEVLRRLIDDTEATNWQSAARQDEGAWSVDGRQVTVDLEGDAPVRVNRVQVSAMLGPIFDPRGQPNPTDLAQSRFTALRQFEVWSCNARREECATGSGFRRVYTSPADAFPGDAPRPVAPQLLLRSFEIPSTRATHLRLLVRASQCTGGPDFQGEQDADPYNATDCDTAGPAGSRFVRAAEFQAFGRPAGVVAEG